MSVGVRAKTIARRPAAGVLGAVTRLSPARAGLALCYHRVGDPPGRAGYVLVPAMGTRLFAAQMRDVRARYRLVRASELPEAVATRRRGERFPLAVTFDDDLAVHATVTAPMLRALGVPATFFVGGPALDGPRPFFWEAIQHALDRGLPADDPLLPRVPDPGGRGGAHRLAAAVRVLPAAEREALTAALLERVGGEAPEPGLREPAMRGLAAAGFELGFHTRDHPALDELGDEALAAALLDGRERVEAAAGRPLTTIAYPFGRADARVARAARAAGFTIGFTLAEAPIRPEDDPLLLGRYQPSFGSAGETAMQLGRGLLSAAR